LTLYQKSEKWRKLSTPWKNGVNYMIRKLALGLLLAGLTTLTQNARAEMRNNNDRADDIRVQRTHHINRANHEGKAGATAITAAPLGPVASVYPGNGNSGFGGAIGGGSLSLSDDGTTISGTLTRGAGIFNDVLVIYLDTTAGGFSDTSSLADGGDGLRKAISGFDGGINRSVLTMPSGFGADYALALGPSSDSFGGLWQLAAGGANSLVFGVDLGLSPLGNNASATYNFSFSLASIGLTPNSGASFNLLGTYISNTGFRSDEFIAGNGTGTQGYNPFTGTSSVTFTTAAIPEPGTVLLVGPAILGGWFFIRRRRA
jgi:hypothetical protein